MLFRVIMNRSDVINVIWVNLQILMIGKLRDFKAKAIFSKTDSIIHGSDASKGWSLNNLIWISF